MTSMSGTVDGLNSSNRIFFFIIYFIYCFKSMLFYLSLDKNIIDEYIDILNIALVLISSIAVLYSNLRIKIIFSFIILFIFLNLFIEKNTYVISYIVIFSLCTLSAQISWEKIITTTLLTHCFIILFIAFPMVFFSQHFFIQDERFGERFTAGFEHPNTYGQYVVFIFTVFTLYLDTCTKNHFLQWIFGCLAALVLCIGVYYSYSRTTNYILFILLIYFTLTRFLKSTPFNSSFLSRFWILLTLGIIIFQFYSIIFYQTMNNGVKLNEILSGRLWYGNNLYAQVGSPRLLIGTNIDDFLPIDFFFIKYIYGLGVFVSIISVFVAYKFVRKNKYTWYVWGCLFSMLIVSISESYLTTPFFCIALFIIFSNSGGKELESEKDINQLLSNKMRKK